jgi:hypothetical protein
LPRLAASFQNISIGSFEKWAQAIVTYLFITNFDDVPIISGHTSNTIMDSCISVSERLQ